MLAPCTPKQNHFPAALADADDVRLLPILELIPYAPGSWRVIAAAGNKDMPGIALFMGSEAISNRPLVRNASYACRLKLTLSAAVKRESDCLLSRNTGILDRLS
jgi:hypothetical protein